MPDYTLRTNLKISGEPDDVFKQVDSLLDAARRLGFQKAEEEKPVAADLVQDIKITPTFSSIMAVKEIYDPWIEIWKGDEWGESIGSLHQTIKTDYGISDEECVTLCYMLTENMQTMREWMDDEGHDYGLSNSDQEKWAAEKARQSRDYWLGGGNLGNFEPAVTAAQETIETLPAWLFGDEDA